MSIKYIKHKLTAYHYRYGRDKLTTLAICDCGWKNKIFRQGIKGKLRKAKCVFGHRWDEPSDVEVGEVYQADNGEWISAIDEGDGEVVGTITQCNRCYKCV